MTVTGPVKGSVEIAAAGDVEFLADGVMAAIGRRQRRWIPFSPILAAAAAVTAAVGLMALARKFTDKAWLQFIGLGFSAIWIPYLAWGGVLSFIPVKVALMLALLAMGMFYGPIIGLIDQYDVIQRGLASMDRVFEFLDLQPVPFKAPEHLGRGNAACGRRREPFQKTPARGRAPFVLILPARVVPGKGGGPLARK